MSLIPWRNKERETELSDWRDRSPVGLLRNEMDRIFDRALSGPWGFGDDDFGRGFGWMPSIDISEGEKEITVRAETPGVDPKDVDISISGQLLTISGEKKESSESERSGVHYTERRFGSFRRTVQLPVAVDPENVAAEQKHGVLMIRLKKSKEAIPKRIAVKFAD